MHFIPILTDGPDPNEPFNLALLVMLAGDALSALSLQPEGVAGFSAGSFAVLNAEEEFDAALAPAEESSVTDILAGHMQAASERFDTEGFTRNQLQALEGQPGLEPAFRGDRIDAFAKESASKDPVLQELGISITPRFRKGPDFFDAANGRWWDITTPAQWARHVSKYGEWGEGTGLFY